MKDVTEDVGLGRNGTRVKSQCPKGPNKKPKGKNIRKDEENDVGKGSNGSFSFNIERDIMSQDNVTDLPKIIKERNEDDRKVNKWKDQDKSDIMDECKTSEERLHENEEEHGKKHRSDEVKEKNDIDKGECNDRGTLNSEIGENIKDKKEMGGKRGSETDRKADNRGRNDEDKGNIFENMKRKSK